MSYLLLLHLPHHHLLSSCLVTAGEEVGLVVNMRVRVKCSRIVRIIRQQASLISPNNSSNSRPRELPILAIQGSNRATTSIILVWRPTIPSTTTPPARLVTHPTTIRGTSKDTLPHPLISLDLATTLTCTLQVKKF